MLKIKNLLRHQRISYHDMNSNQNLALIRLVYHNLVITYLNCHVDQL